MSEAVVVTRERVTAPPDRFIDVPDESIVRFFQGVFPPEQEQDISTLQLLLDGICGMNFKEVQRRLEGSFSFFAAAAAGKVPKTHKGSWDELDLLEVQFLGDFWEVMKAAHYKFLGRQEWEKAQEEDFICTLPVSVKYNAMDDQLLRRFWDQHGGEGGEDAPPELKDRIMVFYRGVGVAHMRGSYFSQKIEFLVSFWVLEPLLKALTWLFRLLRLRAAAELPESLVSDSLKKAASKGFDDAPTVGAEEEAPAAGGKGQQHPYAIKVERRTFARVFPDGASVFKQLFKKVDLQEASFEDVVVLYRTAPQSKPGQQGEFDLIHDSDPAVLARNIHIKHFKQVPLADLDIVLPDRTVHLPPTMLVSTVVTIVLGVAAVVGLLMQGKLTASVVWNAVMMAATRAMQVYASAQNQRTEVEKQLGKMLYNHTAASQEAVLQRLIEEVSKQRAREMFVCYCVLLHTVLPLTATQLDHKCEQFLARKFGLRIDFTAENAAPALLRWGLITQDDAGLLHALPLHTALKKLDEIWDSMYDFSDESEAQQAEGPDKRLGPRLAKGAAFSFKLPSLSTRMPLRKAISDAPGILSFMHGHKAAGASAGPATPVPSEGVQVAGVQFGRKPKGSILQRATHTIPEAE